MVINLQFDFKIKTMNRFWNSVSTGMIIKKIRWYSSQNCKVFLKLLYLLPIIKL